MYQVPTDEKQTNFTQAYKEQRKIWLKYVLCLNLCLHCKPIPCNENRGFPVKFSHREIPVKKQGSLQLEQGFPVMKTGFSLCGKLHRENPVLTLYWPCTGLQCESIQYLS
jgi:hypothetical protein